jgi:hypothetical protein
VFSNREISLKSLERCRFSRFAVNLVGDGSGVLPVFLPFRWVSIPRSRKVAVTRLDKSFRVVSWQNRVTVTHLSFDDESKRRRPRFVDLEPPLIHSEIAVSREIATSRNQDRLILGKRGVIVRSAFPSPHLGTKGHDGFHLGHGRSASLEATVDWPNLPCSQNPTSRTETAAMTPSPSGGQKSKMATTAKGEHCF